MTLNHSYRLSFVLKNIIIHIYKTIKKKVISSLSHQRHFFYMYVCLCINIIM